MSTPGSPIPLAHVDTVVGGLSEAQARAIWRAVAEARAAVTRWGKHVRALVEGGARDKVAPLRRPT